MSSHPGFMNRRLHSLLGIIPVGFFLLEHLFSNYYATKGMKAYVEQVEWIQSLPFLLLMEIIFIFLPLLYHEVYGLYVAFRAKNNLQNYETFRNTMFVLQRITGVATLLFVLWHVYETRIQVALHNYSAQELAHNTSLMLQNNLIFVLYIIRIVSAIFHFSNGM
jgi:succinate dehydrogenase / fumarate reductase cytochrome b subunit